MDDQHGGSRVGSDGGSDAAGKVPHEPAAAVGAEHDQARARAPRRPRRCPSRSAPPGPRCSAAGTLPSRPGRLPSRGGPLGGLLHLARPPRRRNAARRRGRSRRRRAARRRRRARRGRARAGGRPPRSRASRARSRRRRRGPARLDRGLGVARVISVGALGRGLAAAEPARSFARSGGEYHAGPSPARKRSRSGGLRAGAAEHVDRDAEHGAADGEAEADPERDRRCRHRGCRRRSRRSGRRSARS